MAHDPFASPDAYPSAPHGAQRIPGHLDEAGHRSRLDQPAKVVIVDDDPQLGRALSEHVSSTLHNVEVITYCWPTEALEDLAGTGADLLICDYQMPDMSGLDLLAELKHRRPDMASIMMTGHGDIGVATKAINELGVDLFFTKPFDVDELIPRAAELLAHQHRERLKEKALATAASLANDADAERRAEDKKIHKHS